MFAIKNGQDIPARLAHSVVKGLALSCFIVGSNCVPVDHAPKRLQIIGSTILVFEIIGMLPHIAT
jgi:hypothetical protein